MIFADFQFWRVAHKTVVNPVVDGHKNSKHDIYYTWGCEDTLHVLGAHNQCAGYDAQ